MTSWVGLTTSMSEICFKNPFDLQLYSTLCEQNLTQLSWVYCKKKKCGFKIIGVYKKHASRCHQKHGLFLQWMKEILQFFSVLSLPYYLYCLHFFYFVEYSGKMHIIKSQGFLILFVTRDLKISCEFECAMSVGRLLQSLVRFSKNDHLFHAFMAIGPTCNCVLASVWDLEL